MRILSTHGLRHWMANASVGRAVVVVRDFGSFRKRLKSVSRHFASETYMYYLNSHVPDADMDGSLCASKMPATRKFCIEPPQHVPGHDWASPTDISDAFGLYPQPHLTRVLSWKHRYLSVNSCCYVITYTGTMSRAVWK